MGNILGDVAEVGDFGLHAPVPFILEQKRVVVEEAKSQKGSVKRCLDCTCRPSCSPRVEATHEVVALHATIHDRSIALLSNTLLGNLLVNPVRETPSAWLDLAKLDSSRCIVSHSLLEGFVEFGVVEEDIGVVVPSVEMPLDRLDGLNYAVNLLVPGQHNKGSVGSWF